MFKGVSSSSVHGIEVYKEDNVKGEYILVLKYTSGVTSHFLFAILLVSSCVFSCCLFQIDVSCPN